MSTQQPEALRALAEAVKEWSSTDVWPHADCEYTAVLGNIDEDGNQYPIAEINADTYGHDGESLALAKFYGAATPAAVLDLLDRIADLETQLARKAPTKEELADYLMQQDAVIVARSTYEGMLTAAGHPAPQSMTTAAQERLIAAKGDLYRSRIGMKCSRCSTGKYRADSNGYHDFHRCDSCLHVPMFVADGNEWGTQI